LSKETIILDLLELFRHYGYDGVSIARISEATGLGKASLYHHFPRGKEQMAEEVLSFVADAVNDSFIGPLKGRGEPKEKLAKMAKAIEHFYDFGGKGCLVESLTIGAAGDLFQASISELVKTWIQAIANVAIEAGVSKKIAYERAENVVINVEGSLILARAVGNAASFKRLIRLIPTNVIEG
jgi:TetR/AcrR family transcriptional regulator, lmrAB and yxaGH operons repressor